jgi:hypothetical protein
MPEAQGEGSEEAQQAKGQVMTDEAATPSMRADILDALDWLERSATIKDNSFNVPEIKQHNEMASAQAERVRLALFSIPSVAQAKSEPGK